MGLAIFDLDNTLLEGDSDYLWGRFLVEQGLVDGADYERENLAFYEAYKAGTLDIFAFLRFALRPLSQLDLATLHRLRERFMSEKIAPIILPAGRRLLASHRARGDTVLIITATNRFVTAPIAAELGVDHLLATEPQRRNGRYTGEVDGVPCFQEGKVTRLARWLAECGLDLSDSWFYSDSHNDVPLLDKVTHPVAVDPDATLANLARERGWPIISLRQTAPPQSMASPHR